MVLYTLVTMATEIFTAKNDTFPGNRWYTATDLIEARKTK